MSREQRTALGAYQSYLNSTMYDLYDAYEHFSHAKAIAWEYCMRLCYEKGGHGLKIIGRNSHFFSAGFEFEENGKNMFMYITAYRNTAVEV